MGSFRDFKSISTNSNPTTLKYLKIGTIGSIFFPDLRFPLIISQISIELTRTHSPPLIKYNLIRIQTLPTRKLCNTYIIHRLILIQITIFHKQDHTSFKIPAVYHTHKHSQQCFPSNCHINSTYNCDYQERIIDNFNIVTDATYGDKLFGVEVGVLV